MKKLLSTAIVLFVLLSTLLLAATAFAQDEVKEDFFFKSTQKYIPDPSEDGDALKSSTNSGVARTLMQSLTMENKKIVEDDEDFGPLRESNSKEWNAAYYGTFNSHLEGMHSDAIKDFMNESGKGIVALYKYAQLQTEPSIATGSSLAQDLVFSVQRQVLESDRTFRQQLEANPEFKHISLATYNGCLKKQFADGKKYIEAISICQNDSIEEPAGNFAGLTGEILSAREHHPDRVDVIQITTHDSLPNDMQSAQSVSVIDSLVNQAAALSISVAAARDFGDNFKKWFGDYLVQFEEGDSDQLVLIKEARVKPEKTPNQLIDELADDRFDSLMKLLKAACEAYLAAPAPTTGQKLGDTAQASNFWANGAIGANKEDLLAVSIPEFPMKGIIGDSFMNYIGYLDSNKIIADCSVWNKKAADIGKDDYYLPVYNLYYIFAHNVATHQLLWSFQNALLLTTRLAGLGEINNQIREKALSLIGAPFGTLDFETLKQRNLAILVANIDKRVIQEQMHMIGAAGSRVTASSNTSANK